MWKNLFLTKSFLVSGEGKDVTEKMTDPWKEATLQTIISNYAKTDIYNAGEFVLFYKDLPKKTLHVKDDKYTGGKHSKIKVTGLAAANINGDKLPMFVIGKSKKPRCFKCQKITSSLSRPEQKLDEFNSFRKLGQMA